MLSRLDAFMDGLKEWSIVVIICLCITMVVLAFLPVVLVGGICLFIVWLIIYFTTVKEVKKEIKSKCKSSDDIFN